MQHRPVRGICAVPVAHRKHLNGCHHLESPWLCRVDGTSVPVARWRPRANRSGGASTAPSPLRVPSSSRSRGRAGLPRDRCPRQGASPAAVVEAAAAEPHGRAAMSTVYSAPNRKGAQTGPLRILRMINSYFYYKNLAGSPPTHLPAYLPTLFGNILLI